MNKYQEALNALCDEDEMYKLAKGFSFDDDYTSEYDYEKAKEYCKNVVQELIDNYAWIPVEERLPEEDGLYLCSFDDGFIASVDYISGNGFMLWVDSGEVNAWMPLPEPYESKQGDN